MLFNKGVFEMEQCDNDAFVKFTLFKNKQINLNLMSVKLLRRTIEIAVLQSALNPDGIFFLLLFRLACGRNKYTLGCYLESVHCYISRGRCMDFPFQNGKELKTFIMDLPSGKHLYLLSCMIL